MFLKCGGWSIEKRTLQATWRASTTIVQVKLFKLASKHAKVVSEAYVKAHMFWFMTLAHETSFYQRITSLVRQYF